ncbi:MAG: hypothetical protein H0X30_05575 [Anaerolineae bacterium]|nr:hypothetical protein [Anaerolineae bacterium]
MDSFMMMASGHVGKVQGIGRDRQGAPVYRFSLAINFSRGDHDETLWLQCTVSDPLLNIVTERGILTGDHLLVVVDNAQVNAVLAGQAAKGWLNCRVQQITFLVSPAVPQLERGEGYESRTILDYAELMRQKVG